MNISIPAYLSDFSTLDNQRTVAKLKVFYVGETADGRIFDEKFSNKLIQSIAYTPVVAFYSDLKDDFIGHNGTQYIYGIVAPDAENGFETDEDGVVWFITEVLLYTDRIDNIGDVAKKIVGKQQSLEIDPSTIEYEVIKKDGERKIHFLDGRLCGLSVLGSDQKPAFSGSEFFVENADLKERFENFFSFLTNEDRGAVMNKDYFKQYADFIELSYSEKFQMASHYFMTQFGDEYYPIIEDMDESTVVVTLFKDYQGEVYKFDYSITEEGNFEASNQRKCFKRFLTVEEINKLEGSSTTEMTEESEARKKCGAEDESEDESGQAKKKCGAEDSSEEGEARKKCGAEESSEEDEGNARKKCGAKEDPEDPEDPDDDPMDDDPDDDEECGPERKRVCTVLATDSTFTDEGEANEQEEQGLLQKEEKAEENFTSSATELTNSEREELEAYRFEKRIRLVDSYKDDLPAETISSFSEMAKTISYEELEAKLAIEFRKFSKQNKNNSGAIFNLNTVVTTTVKERELTYADLVKATLNK